METISKVTIVIVVVALLIGGILGFLISALWQSPISKVTKEQVAEQSSPTVTTSTGGNDIFSSQSATVEGVITDHKNNSVTVKNSQNNKLETFNLDPAATILRLSTRTNNAASPSSDLKNMALNSPVIVNLVLKNGQYTVVNIAYLPAVPNSP